MGARHKLQPREQIRPGRSVSGSEEVAEIAQHIDAGARKIEVLIQRGGLSLIRILDDGHGMSRDDAYRIVQRNAMRAWDEGTDFRALLEADPEVPDELLDEAFDLRRSLSNLDVVFAQLDGIAV